MYEQKILFDIPFLLLTVIRCSALPDTERYYLIRVQSSRPFSDRFGPKTSLLIVKELPTGEINSDSLQEIQKHSSIHQKIVYYFQFFGADVIDFNPERSVINRCCNFGDGGYIDQDDSIKNDPFYNYPIVDSSFRNIDMCDLPKVVVSVCKVNSAVATCQNIRALTSEYHKEDSVSYFCKILGVEKVNDFDLQYLKDKLKILNIKCD